jgi:hypothetical protein
MKKLIFTGLAIAFGYSSIAQKLALPAEPNVKASNKAVRNQTKSFSKDNISEWFSVEEMVNASDLGTILLLVSLLCTQIRMPKVFLLAVKRAMLHGKVLDMFWIQKTM